MSGRSGHPLARRILAVRAQCTWCHTVRVWRWWLPLPRGMLPRLEWRVVLIWRGRRTEIAASGSICSRCAREILREVRASGHN